VLEPRQQSRQFILNDGCCAGLAQKAAQRLGIVAFVSDQIAHSV
jgi:hypothetical protein